MDVLIASAVLIAAVVISLVAGISTVPAFLLGLVLYVLVSLRRGFAFKTVLYMVWSGAKQSFPVVEILLLIGILTGVWRAGGTMALLITAVVKTVSPQLFVFIAFLSAAVMSYLMGSCFGTAGTLGAVFMMLARAGGVNTLVVAGAVISGAYFGDRTAPVAPCINFVTGITKTDLYGNVRLMWKSSLVPLLLCGVLYFVLSFFNPLSEMDGSITAALENGFSIHILSVLPAVILLLLPLFKVKVTYAVTASSLAAAVMALAVEHMPAADLLTCAVMGYASSDAAVNTLMAGGGMVSMLDMSLIILVSCSFAGVIGQTGMLDFCKPHLEKAAQRISPFWGMTLMGWVLGAVFCNVTIVQALNYTLWYDIYKKRGASDAEIALDLQNGVLMACCLVPWAVSCSVPFAMLDTNTAALPFVVFTYAEIIWYGIMKKKWFPQKNACPEMTS